MLSENTVAIFLSRLPFKTRVTVYFSVISLIAYLVTDCDISDTEEAGTWGHLSPSNPRHWDTLVWWKLLSHQPSLPKYSSLSLITTRRWDAPPLIGQWESSLNAYWSRHELVNLIHDLWYTFPRYWHWHNTARCQYKEFRKLPDRFLNERNVVYSLNQDEVHIYSSFFCILPIF